MSRVTIATWIYCEPSGEESRYPQVSGNPSSPQFQAVYWKCVATFFASSIRCNPNSPHVLFTTSSTIPRIEGVDLAALFSKWNIKVVTVPFTYIPPIGYYGLWRNQFYILDLIKYLAKVNDPEASYLILDSDCVFNKPIADLESDLQRDDLLTYDCELSPNEVANGLDSHDLMLLYNELGLVRITPPAYFGGEFFAATNVAIQRLASEIDSLWSVCLDRHHKGLKKFNEEAHFLSFLYYKLGYVNTSANSYIGRLWTQRKFRNTTDSDLSLAIWHLPAEKKYGLQRIYKQAVQCKTKFWRLNIGEEYTKYLGAYLGVPRASKLKYLQDTLTAIANRPLLGSTPPKHVKL